jgi:hypothetical protein
VHEESFPFSVGGYRIGRRLSQGRYLGHALAPSLVELVFLNQLASEQQRRVCVEAQDFSSLPDGGRVAILPRPTNDAEALNHENPVHVRLTTPHDLVESWRHMEEATAAASTMSPPRDSDGDSLLGRVRGLLKRARRGPLVLAAIAGVVAVIAVVALLPAAPSGTDSITESGTESTSESTSGVNPFSSQLSNPLSNPLSTPPSPLLRPPISAEPVEPLSSLGDFILVRVPAKSGEEPGEIAVLERSADTWIVRETYPTTLVAAQ